MKTKYDEGVKALRNRLKLSQTELATELDRIQNQTKIVFEKSN